MNEEHSHLKEIQEFSETAQRIIRKENSYLTEIQAFYKRAHLDARRAVKNKSRSEMTCLALFWEFHSAYMLACKVDAEVASTTQYVRLEHLFLSRFGLTKIMTIYEI
jgi:hypothetical protein